MTGLFIFRKYIIVILTTNVRMTIMYFLLAENHIGVELKPSRWWIYLLGQAKKKWLVSLELAEYYKDRMLWQLGNSSITLNLFLLSGISYHFISFELWKYMDDIFYMSGADCVLSSWFLYGFISCLWHWNTVPGTKSVREADVQTVPHGRDPDLNSNICHEPTADLKSRPIVAQCSITAPTTTRTHHASFRFRHACEQKGNSLLQVLSDSRADFFLWVYGMIYCIGVQT